MSNSSTAQRKILFVLLAAALTAGCATSHRVRASGYLDRTSPEPIAAGAAFAVQANPAAPNPIFDQEVRRKIETSLAAQGYRIVPEGEADYFVSYNYEIAARSETSTYPGVRTGPDIIQHVRVNGSKGAYTVISPGYSFAAYETRTRMVYGSRLFVRVLSAPERRAQKERVLWVGESMADGSSPDLRESIDYLVAGMFRFFGQDTARSREVRLTAQDPLLARLTAVNGGAPAPASSSPTAAA